MGKLTINGHVELPEGMYIYIYTVYIRSIQIQSDLDPIEFHVGWPGKIDFPPAIWDV